MKNLHRLSVLLKHPAPSESTWLKPSGFKSSEDEYKFFFETETVRPFKCPSGSRFMVSALNYYWEALHIIEKHYGKTQKDIVEEVWELNRYIGLSEAEYEREFKVTLLNLIEDYMEEGRYEHKW